MQYYSRTQPPTRGAGVTVPGTAFTPDGKLHLAMPVRRAAPSSGGAGSNMGNHNADGNSSNELVLINKTPMRFWTCMSCLCTVNPRTSYW